MDRSRSAIIIDDEKSARNILLKLLELHCPQIKVFAVCENLKLGVEKINMLQPDLVFLDIEMPNYAGYEIGRFFEKINFEIIFVTAYDSYAVRAFELSALDYLLKPIDVERLKHAVGKFLLGKEMKDANLSYRVLLESLSQESSKKLVIQVKGGQKAILLADIVAIEASSAYSVIHTKGEGTFLYSKHLKHFEGLLSGNKAFIRTHKSWIVNLNYLDSYSKSRFTIKMNNGIEAKLSKYRKESFENALLN